MPQRIPRAEGVHVKSGPYLSTPSSNYYGIKTEVTTHTRQCKNVNTISRITIRRTYNMCIASLARKKGKELKKPLRTRNSCKDFLTSDGKLQTGKTIEQKTGNSQSWDTEVNAAECQTGWATAHSFWQQLPCASKQLAKCLQVQGLSQDFA